MSSFIRGFLGNGIDDGVSGCDMVPLSVATIEDVEGCEICSDGHLHPRVGRRTGLPDGK
jgi:hypothetical protein